MPHPRAICATRSFRAFGRRRKASGLHSRTTLSTNSSASPASNATSTLARPAARSANRQRRLGHWHARPDRPIHKTSLGCLAAAAQGLWLPLVLPAPAPAQHKRQCWSRAPTSGGACVSPLRRAIFHRRVFDITLVLPDHTRRGSAINRRPGRRGLRRAHRAGDQHSPTPADRTVRQCEHDVAHAAAKAAGVVDELRLGAALVAARVDSGRLPRPAWRHSAQRK